MKHFSQKLLGGAAILSVEHFLPVQNADNGRTVTGRPPHSHQPTIERVRDALCAPPRFCLRHIRAQNRRAADLDAFLVQSKAPDLKTVAGRMGKNAHRIEKTASKICPLRLARGTSVYNFVPGPIRATWYICGHSLVPFAVTEKSNQIFLLVPCETRNKAGTKANETIMLESIRFGELIRTVGPS